MFVNHCEKSGKFNNAHFYGRSLAHNVTPRNFMRQRGQNLEEDDGGRRGGGGRDSRQQGGT